MSPAATTKEQKKKYPEMQSYTAYFVQTRVTVISESPFLNTNLCPRHGHESGGYGNLAVDGSCPDACGVRRRT